MGKAVTTTTMLMSDALLLPEVIPSLVCGHLAERPEARADFFRKQLRLFPGREVAAFAGLVEVDEVGVDLLGPAARSLEDLAGERRDAGRELHLRTRLPGRVSCGLSALPVRAGGRGPDARQPVQRDVVQDVVPGEIARGLAAKKRAGDLVVVVGVVIEHPGRQRDR